MIKTMFLMVMMVYALGAISIYSITRPERPTYYIISDKTWNEIRR